MSNGSFVRKIKKISPLVRDVLERIPETRDNDAKLQWNVWQLQLPDIRLRSVNEVANLHIKGKLCSWESITRCRRKLQEENKNLRGKKYYARTKEEAEVRKQIKTLFD